LIRKLWRIARGHRLVGESAWLLSGTLFHTVTSLAAVRAYTELARPEVYSEANLVLGLLFLTVNIFITPIGNGVARYFTEWMVNGKLRAAWQIANHLAFSGAAIGAGIVMVGLSMVWATHWSMLILLVPFFAVHAWRSVALNIINASRRQSDYALWIAAEALFSVLATVLCLTLEARPESFVAGQLLGSAIAAWLMKHRFDREMLSADKGGAKQSIDARARLLRYGLPFVPIAVATWFISMGERYTLSILADLDVTGRYIAAAALASRPGLLLAGTLSNLFRPILFEARTHGNHSLERKVIAVWVSCVLIFGFAIVAVFLSFGDILAYFILAKEYRDGAPILMGIIALGGTAYGIANIAENVILASERSAKLIGPLLCGVVVNIGAGMFWIPSLGAFGAAWSSTAGFGCEMLASIWMAHVLSANKTNAGE